ncbi:MAG: HEAT repeat domain-containing protein, partial [Gemmataceae bacterium]
QLALEHRGRQGEQAVRQALAGNKLGKRGRLHAVWLLARAAKPNLEDLLHMAGNDPEQAVRIQAIRALADLADPVLVHHRLDAAAADPGLAAKLAALAENAPPAIIREVVIALGRLRWADTPMWLRKHLGAADAVLAHAAMQALRQAGNWPETLKLVDLPNTTPLQGIALRAVAERYELAVVDGLVARLGGQGTASRRSAYAELLARVHRRPGPWEYWGYRPGPRPANSVDWERTAAIQEALDRVVANGDGLLRLATLHAMSLERVPVKLSSLRRWLREERSEAGIAAILESLGEQPATAVREDLASVIVRPQAGLANRLRALALYEAGLDQAGASALLEMVARLEDGPVLAAALPLASKFPQGKAGTLVARHLDSSDGAVRAAALRTLGELGANEGQAAVLRFLDDKQAPVRQAAAFAAGKLRVRASIDVLLKLARDPDAGVRRASLESLGLLREPRVVPLAAEALADHETDLAALGCLRELGGPEQSPRLVELCRRSPSGDVLDTALRILTSWGDRPELDDKVRNQLDRSVADIQGDSGVLLRWHALGPQSAAQAADVVKRIGAGQNCGPNWRRLFASGADPRIQLPGAKNAADAVWLAFSDVALPKETAVEVLGSSGSTLQVWLNGKPVYERKQAAGFRAGSDRFVLTLPAGLSRLLVKVKAAAEPVDVHLRLRRKSASADHERITQAALSRSGNVERGRQVFFNVEKSLCLKCHRVGEQGERIGPELSGVGGRFARVYIVESILEPSRTIAPSFGSIGIVLKSGKVLSGIKLAEDARTLTLADNQGQKHAIMKDDIDEQQPLHASTMPEGLEKRLSEAEFVDLVAFLVSLKAGTSNVKK